MASAYPGSRGDLSSGTIARLTDAARWERLICPRTGNLPRSCDEPGSPIRPWMRVPPKASAPHRSLAAADLIRKTCPHSETPFLFPAVADAVIMRSPPAAIG